MRQLLIGALLAIWCATLSGVALRLAPQPLLILHLVSSVGGVVLIAAYLSHHWWARQHMLKHRVSRSTLQGYIALACLALLALTGFALLHWTNVPALRWLHTGAMIVLLLDLAVHMSWRVWLNRPSSNLTRPRTTHRRLWGGIASAGLILLLTGLLRPTASGQAAEWVPIAPASLGSRTLFAAQDCAGCHNTITQHWQSSAHAHAATDAYYRAVTTLFIEERGPQAVQFCATCHNPIGLMQGEVDVAAVTSANPFGSPAYAARHLGVTLQISPRAAEGVSCALCHQAAQVAVLPGNGSLSLATDLPALPTNALTQLTLRAAPDSHATALLRPVIQQAELCGSCHNLRLPDNNLAVEPTYDEWLASPYPERGTTCQTCHFPPTPGSKADSSAVQTIGAHGSLPGAISSLPGLAADATVLRSAATLSARLTPDPADPSGLLATVIVTNTGAGHQLPTGANDLRQMWLEVTLHDSAQQVLWSSGVLDNYGTLDPGAVQFHKILGDANGHPIDLHRIWIATQILEDTSLRPLEARLIQYAIPVSAARRPLTLTVRLLYRDVSQAFAEFALDRAVTDLPVREMVRFDVDLK